MTGLLREPEHSFTLCPDCQELYDGWVNYQAPVRGWVTLNNPVQSAENRHRLLEERRDLIRHQLAGIVETCHRKHLDNKPNLG